MLKRSAIVNAILTPLACVVLVIASAFILLLPSGTKSSDTAALATGISYIEGLESRDVSSVDRELRLRVTMDALEGMDTWEKLDYYDTYIMGDSRVEPFLWYLKPEHVFADKSTTIKYIEERIDDIASAKPGNLVLSFGMNDIGMYEFEPEDYWETAEDYVEAYPYYIDLIREASPETNIYINSIIPALEAGIERQPRWILIPEWNEALRKFCESYGVGYIDTTYITDVYGEYFDDDGVHFYVQDAVTDWGESILSAIQEQEIGA